MVVVVSSSVVAKRNPHFWVLGKKRKAEGEAKEKVVRETKSSVGGGGGGEEENCSPRKKTRSR